MNDLPRGWARTTLGAVCEVVSGATPKTGVPGNWGGDIPWVTPDDLSKNRSQLVGRGARFLTRSGLESCSARLLPPGTVLYSSRAPIGYAAIAANAVATNQGFKSLIPPRGLSSKYLYWYMSFITPEVRRRASGTTFLEISKAAISEVPLRIPPTAEQERIVAAIEEEFSRIEAGVAAIARAQRRLNALVGAAMDSIVTEAAISDPGWRVLSPTQIAANVPNALAIGPFGSDLKVSDYRSDGVPLIFVRNIRERTFSGARLKFIAREKADELRSHAVRGGDVLITKMGDPPGDTAVYPTGLPNAILTADCIKLTPAAGFDAQYLALVMRTRRVRNEFLAATRGVAQQKLSLDRFKRQIHLPVPEFDEQVGIAQRLDLLASRVRKCADEMNEASRVAQALRSAVLVAAFSGRLGPQDPKDEPASVLLERTTRGREPSGAHPKRRSHGYRPKVSA